ncbi:hydroxyacylglutathione hydrolase [Martelella mediterranea]|uniref:Hydroxyacylglutathione hydrolase n=1 Tax=Martelella mediterranea TaxID=293089 RepID=A0A4R3NY61_9HYPH|nr:hydroxyacylglutathione hydrolase [Martelella mediterranea]TCT45116.1 hydroxyacylglutathione hydrolase [Martelella mediterranea]
MTRLEIAVFMCRSDNYGVLVHDPETGRTATIDAPDADAVAGEAEKRGWKLTDILTTHHHKDHVEGNLPLKERYGCRIVGPVEEAVVIPGLDLAVAEGDPLEFAGHRIEVIETPGHTAGHICYHFVDDKLLFAADTLFAMGCGRLFERPAAVMLTSLEKLMALPDDTEVYFGHEYTLANAKFALSVDGDNQVLKERAEAIAALRDAGDFTIPTTIGLEKKTNPFLRFENPAMRAGLEMENASNAEVLAEIRRRKDHF